MIYLKRFLKFSLFFGFAVFILFILDATDYDSKYENRDKIEISSIHLNSQYSFKFANFLRQNYYTFYSIFFKKSFEKRWSIESSKTRESLPEEKIVKKKTKNFSDQLYKTSDYLTSNDWFRSHGNFFSTRFSNLKEISKNNVNQLQLAWTYESKVSSKIKKEIQANVIFDNRTLYIPDVNNKIVALNALNGEKIWEFKIKEGVVARRGLIIWPSKENNKKNIFFTDNRKYLYGISAENGKPLDKFGDKGKVKVGLTPLPPIIFNNEIILITTDNVIKSYDLIYGKIKWKYKVNKTKNNLIFQNFKKGSPWGGLSLDEKRGLLFFTTGNPEPWHVGIGREGNNLYANSLVAFDLNKKDIKWHFQEIPHDVWNFDLAAPPILTMTKKNNQLIDVVLAVSKTGNVILLDRESGEPMFDLKYVRAPVSNVPGERTSPYQLNIELPEPICRGKFNKEYLTEFDNEFVDDFNSNIDKYNFGFPSPPLLDKINISIGSCVRWSGGSVDTQKNVLYISSDNYPDLIYLQKDDKKFSYYHEWDSFVDNDGYPAIKPPWGAITALNLNSGKIIWQKPFGTIKELEKRNIFNTGSSNRAGITATAGNLIFASGTDDNLFRVYDSLTGDELWSFKLDAPGSAPPTIFTIDNKQYILVPAYEKSGNKVYCFTLK